MQSHWGFGLQHINLVGHNSVHNRDWAGWTVGLMNPQRVSLTMRRLECTSLCPSLLQVDLWRGKKSPLGMWTLTYVWGWSSHYLWVSVCACVCVHTERRGRQREEAQDENRSDPGLVMPQEINGSSRKRKTVSSLWEHILNRNSPK